MYYNEDDTRKILDTCNDRLVDVIGDFIKLDKKTGGKFVGDCPNPKCGKINGLEISTGKGLYKCFRCDTAGNTAITYLMKTEGKSYPEALDYLNRKFSIVADAPQQSIKKVAPKIAAKKTSTFCHRMLTESGLTRADITAKIIDITTKATKSTVEVFESGTVDAHFVPVYGEKDDDVIIKYFDLDGNPCKYEEVIKGKPTGKIKEFFRVRFQFPDEHKDKDGKPTKYKSPWGSHAFLYIPDIIREMYRTGQKIETLLIQEGEKKAEKACKHGIYSVGISGIQNIAGKDKKLPEDLIKIIQKLDIKKVVLLFDDDWNDLSNNIKIADSVEMRPRSFFSAARNYKEYMYSLKNRGIYIETYIGHVKRNENRDKGIDDLLANTLKETPEALKADIDYLINEKDLNGKYVQLFKITSWPDSKLEELWSLNNVKSFVQLHKETLSCLPEFKIGKYVWKLNDKGEVESAQPIEHDEQFWEETQKKTGDGSYKTVCEFIYENNLIFLQNRGFGRFKSMDGTVKLCQLQHPIVRIIDHTYIRDYVKDFIRKIGKKNVLEMLHRGGPQYLGPDKMSDLNYIVPAFEPNNRERQRFYFKSFAWEVTQSGIKQIDYTDITHHIWEEQKHDFEPKLAAKQLITVHKNEDDELSYSISTEGMQCHFLQFLVNCSNFTWRKQKQIENGNTEITIDPQEMQENVIHLISKLSAIGYLLLSAKDKSIPRAVIAMDGEQSEIGQSNGGTGKSLVGDALGQVLPMLYINGKSSELEKDTFLWTEMTDKTKLVFIDDVKVNFNIEFMFPFCTGDWKVNYKGGGRATIPFMQSPKIYIPTNHALNGNGASFTRRQWLIAFSDWYGANHQPKDDFGGLFFDDWDFLQWNGFWNLIADCVQIYLKYGIVEAPQEKLQVRILRQQMGETFLTWADEYFSDELKMGARLHKKNTYDDFTKHSNVNIKFESITLFKKKLQAYCKWKGYEFNPHLYDPITKQPLRYDKEGNPIDSDKAGGIEWVTIARPGQLTVTTHPDDTNKVVPPTDDLPF